MRHPGKTALFFVVLSVGPAAAANRADETAGDQTPDELYETIVTSPVQPAATEPAGSYATLVSSATRDPRVDVQARNLGEGQGDVTIRGGTFENTGLSIGAVSLFDPQTGHYLADVPIPPGMLSAPELLVGVDNAAQGFNSNAGTLAYRWRPIASGVEVDAAAGSAWLNHQRLRAGKRWAEQEESGAGIGAEVEGARAAAAGGVRPDADYAFTRFAARVQATGAASQTDLVAGYQSKFLGWPNLYALQELHDAVGTSGAETDRTKTWLVMLNDSRTLGAGTGVETTAYYRRQRADYELDRYQPGLFNPYEHTTTVWGLGLRGWLDLGPLTLRAFAQAQRDSVDSTALTFGEFTARGYLKLGVVPELAWQASSAARVRIRAGGTFDHTDRDGAALSPLGEVAWVRSSCPVCTQELYAQAARTTQVPGYTALASNPTAGLFRGNRGLGRERSDNVEAGLRVRHERRRLSVAGFRRADHGLVDWTYASSAVPFAARQANAVDVTTTGAEIVAAGGTPRFRLAAGYTYLAKVESYGGLAADASFYALNYPRHRAVASLTASPAPSLGVGVDCELRAQASNRLRRGPSRVALLAARATWSAPWVAGLTITGTAENLTDTRFETVPGVPAAGRRLSVSVGYELRL